MPLYNLSVSFPLITTSNGDVLGDSQEQRLQQSIVLLEEFCKEMTAVVLVSANEVVLAH